VIAVIEYIHGSRSSAAQSLAESGQTTADNGAKVSFNIYKRRKTTHVRGTKTSIFGSIRFYSG